MLIGTLLHRKGKGSKLRTVIIVLVAAMSCFMLSGCWNRRELNELAVSVAVGVDKKGDGIILSDQILNAGAISGQSNRSSTSAPVNLFQESGGSFQEAARKMTRRSTRKIYVGQLQMLILGEDFAREGVTKVLDHISRDHEYRSDFYVIVARETEARDVLRISTPLEKTPATKLKNSLEVSAKAWGGTTAVEFRDFTSNLISKSREAVLTGLRLEGSFEKGNNLSNTTKVFPSARLVFAGLAVFKKDKLIGWLDEKESFGYNFTQGKITSTSLLQPCPDSDRKLTVELVRTKSKMKAFIKDGKPLVQIDVKADGIVTDAQCPLDFTKPETITQIENNSNAQIKSYISSAVQKMQSSRYNSDIFGFGALFERKYPKYWKKAKSEWDSVFPTIQIKIQPKVNVKQMFKTTKSFSERMKE
ncbi:spore germination protein KC [Paenibacillus sp. BK033]|uniref:Ger(x)C family spore germination protein n=1 Tax=Paenibacillus sp. BK033 TaxID=2512133 RepID=UPI00104AA5BC|nr:Ger(x)C family spore germination protein [Paenibacillus sp. BK033]TCM99037.1 spore germination protein KC [Paenibacillus sp. BK033]